MAVHIAGIRMKNFCGYKQAKFNFMGEDGNPLKLITIFGPNGSGKSSLLDGIRFVANPFLHLNRDCRLTFRKLIHQQDYDPVYAFVKDAKNPITDKDWNREEPTLITDDDFNKSFEDLVEDLDIEMELEGVFDFEGDFKNVLFKNKGIVHCDLPKKSKGYAYWIDADHPSAMMKFQVTTEYAQTFLDIAKCVYGYDCDFGPTEVNETIPGIDGLPIHVTFYTDFIIHKDGVKVHFKRMSAGEKKIATFLSMLCDPLWLDTTDIIMVDNIDMHIYFERHAMFVDQLLEKFPEKQFIITTHSGTMIDHIRNKYGVDCLFPIHEIKKG
jgi:AAA15 family ATPase/GTPase